MRRAWPVLLLALALLFAACGRAPAGQQGQPELTDELGVVEVGQGEPILIGYMLVIEGPDAALGTDALRGAEIAVEDRGGQLLGHPVQLVGENDGCSAEGGQAAATKLAANPKIVAVIGASCSSASKVAAPIITRAGMTMISPSSTAPFLTAPDRGPDYAGFLRTAYNDRVNGKVAAEYAYNVLGARSAATIHDGSPFAEQLAKVFAETFRELGGQITNEEAVGPDDIDMKPVLTRIAARKPQVLYFPIFVKAGAHVARQSREVPGLEQTILMSADSLMAPEFVQAAGPAVKGMYLTAADFTAFDPQRYGDFLAKYKRKYGQDPIQAFHVYGYDAAMLIMNAVERVAKQTDDGRLLIGRKALRDALYATKDFKSLGGNLSCDPNGDCADPHIAVYQITEETIAGKWEPGVSPKKVFPTQ